MNNKFYVSILISFFSITISYSQGNSYLPNYAYSKVSTSAWAAGGTGVAESGLRGAPLNNPACLSYKSLTIDGETSGRVKTEADFGYKVDGFVSIPSFLSIGTRVDSMNFSLGYLNYYDFSLHQELRQTNDEGVVLQTFDLGLEQTIHTVFGSANIGVGKFVLGLTWGYNIFTITNKPWIDMNASANSSGLLLVGGVLYKPNANLEIGSSFKYTSHIDYQLRYPEGSYNYHVRTPWVVEAGISGRLNPSFKILASVEYQPYRELESYFENLIQVHAGAVITLRENIDLRTGLFSQTDPFDFTNDKQSQYFLTAGLDVRTEYLSLSFSALNSFLFTPDNKFHQTILSLGGTYVFE